jgi:hypothetical protein
MFEAGACGCIQQGDYFRGLHHAILYGHFGDQTPSGLSSFPTFFGLAKCKGRQLGKL